ncbi:MAG: ATP-binding protein [Verrucomicrobiota bacterium]
MHRVNTLALSILLVVIALASAALFQSWRVQRQTDRALAATRHADSLRREQEAQRPAHLEQIRAWRKSDAPGHRARALSLLEAAARIRPAADLREEALAWLPFSAYSENTPVRFVAPTPNIGFDAPVERAAMAWDNNTIHLFSLSDGKKLFTLPDAQGSVGWLRFSPDGLWLVGRHYSLPTNGTLWNVEKRQVSRRFVAAQGIFSDGAYDFSPDSRQLASADSSGRVQFYDLANGRTLKPLEVGRQMRSLKFCSDPNYLAIADTNTVEIWDLKKREMARRIGTRFTVEWLAWHPDGEWLGMVGVSNDIWLWHWRTGARWQIATREGVIIQLHFHPEGHRLVTTSQNNWVVEWDIATAQPLASVQKSRADHYSPDGRRLSLVKAGEGCTFAMLPDRREYRSFLSVVDAVRGIAWQGNQLLRARDSGLELWNPVTGRRLDFQPWRGAKAVVSAAGACLTAGEQGVIQQTLAQNAKGEWSIGPGRSIPIKELNAMQEAAFSADGSRLAVRHNGQVVIHDSRGQSAPLPLIEAEDARGFCFSPDGSSLAGISTNGCSLWNAATGNRVTTLPGTSTAVVFSPTGQLLVTGGADKLSIHDARTLKTVAQIAPEGGLTPSALAISHDDQWLAVGHTNGVLDLYRTAGLERLGRLERPKSTYLHALRFNDTGSQLAVLSRSGNTFVWDLEAMRAQLSRLRLDFDQPMIAAAPLMDLVSADSRSEVLIVLPLVGVLVAIILGVLALRRYHTLVEGYFQVDALAVRRSEQLAQAQSELFHSQKMQALGTLAAGIAHDFNNLLSIIRMSNKLIAREAKENKEIQENAAEIEQAVEQGKTVVRSMLGYSREAVEDGRPYSVAELVESVVALLGKQFLSGITLTLELAPDTPPVSVSRGRLEQVLLNLVVNASEAMEGKGKLLIALRARTQPNALSTLNARPAPRHLELIVADSGPGIAPENLPRIFEPFFTTKTVGATRGTGLGLSLVYTIAQQDGLGISVESERGKGAAFRIVIPVDEAP